MSSRSLFLLVLLAGCSEAPTRAADDAAPDAPPDTVVADSSVEDSVADSSAEDSAADVAPAKLRVLFVGNSYTYTNDLPALLRRIGATAGAPPLIETEQVVVGGATLQQHWATGDAQKRIDEKTWTYVVLQGQSVEPLLQPTTFATFADQFAERAIAAGAIPTFYATWARAAGDPVYGETWSGGTPEAMQDGLTKAYLDAAAKRSGSIAVKVGEAFRLSLKERPSLALHVADRSHPTLAGSYLAACAFYVKLSGVKVPAVSEVPSGLSADEANHLRSVAERAQ